MHSLSPSLIVDDIERSVAYYRDVLGFDVPVVMPGPDGKPVHAEVRHGAAHIMLESTQWMPPDQVGLRRGVGVNLFTYVDDGVDIDAYYERVRAAGATVTMEIADQFWGDRLFAVADPDGYVLSFARTVRQVSPEEMQAAMSG